MTFRLAPPPLRAALVTAHPGRFHDFWIARSGTSPRSMRATNPTLRPLCEQRDEKRSRRSPRSNPFISSREGALSPHDVSPHDVSSHDVSPHDVSPHEVSPHDASPHDVSPHEVSPHDVSPHKVSPHKVSPHEVSPHSVITIWQDRSQRPASLHDVIVARQIIHKMSRADNEPPTPYKVPQGGLLHPQGGQSPQSKAPHPQWYPRPQGGLHPQAEPRPQGSRTLHRSQVRHRSLDPPRFCHRSPGTARTASGSSRAMKRLKDPSCRTV
jgi:hypothetical protein